MRTFKQFLNESCITRLLFHNQQHECAMLTAFRQFDENNKARSLDQNNKDNLTLGKALHYLGYGITKVIGSYTEQQNSSKTTEENSWFVVNLKDDEKFVDNIINFGITHNQDSVLIIPKNGFFDIKTVYLIGTNKDNLDDDCFIKWQEKKYASDIKFSKNNDLLTKIKNKAFYFSFEESDLLENELSFKNFSNAQEMKGRFKKLYPFIFS